MTSSKKTETIAPYNHKKLNSVNNHMSLEDNPQAQEKECSLASTLTAPLSDPKQRTKLNDVKTPNPRKLKHKLHHLKLYL